MEIIEEPGGSKEQPIPSNADENKPPVKHTKDEVLMDYETLANEEGIPGTPQEPEVSVGLIGGQNKNDERGIDVSRYESFADSQSSTQFEDPADAQYGTGPGNGMHHHPKDGSDDKPKNAVG